MENTTCCRTDVLCPSYITLKVLNSLPVFSHPSLMYIVLDALSFLQRYERMQIYAYVIMENHLHLMATSETLNREIEDFKSFTTHSVVSYLEGRDAQHILQQLERYRTNGTIPFWQQNVRSEHVRSLEVMRQSVDHIHYNPVRRGYVDYPCHWRYSSARNYAGQTGLIDVITDWW